jgi:hypothetical protein
MCHCDGCSLNAQPGIEQTISGQPGASAAAAEQVYQSGADAATHAAMQHYAARTVENIAALGGSWAAAMADSLLINNLVSLWRGTRRAPETPNTKPGNSLVALLRSLGGCNAYYLHRSAQHQVARLDVVCARHSTVFTSLEHLQPQSQEVFDRGGIPAKRHLKITTTRPVQPVVNDCCEPDGARLISRGCQSK